MNSGALALNQQWNKSSTWLTGSVAKVSHDMMERDVYELLDSHDQHPTDDDLISMTEEQNVVAGDDDDEDNDRDAEEATQQPSTQVTLERC